MLKRIKLAWAVLLHGESKPSSLSNAEIQRIFDIVRNSSAPDELEDFLVFVWLVRMIEAHQQI